MFELPGESATKSLKYMSSSQEATFSRPQKASLFILTIQHNLLQDYMG